MPYKDISNKDDDDDHEIFMETVTLTWIPLNVTVQNQKTEELFRSLTIIFLGLI